MFCQSRSATSSGAFCPLLPDRTEFEYAFVRENTIDGGVVSGEPPDHGPGYVSREMIADGVRKARDSGAFFARDGAAEFLALLRSREVATQILSAGLKDVVEVALIEFFGLPKWEVADRREHGRAHVQGPDPRHLERCVMKFESSRPIDQAPSTRSRRAGMRPAGSHGTAYPHVQQVAVCGR